MSSGYAKKNFAAYVGFFLLAPLAWPLAADAGCCRCSAGDFTVPYCFKTDKNCYELENHASFPNLDAFQCSTNISEANCRKISDGGICKEVADANTYKPPSDIAKQVTSSTPAITPTLGVPIPGMTFAYNITPKDGFIQMPFLGQYITGLYRYVTGIILVVAAVMLVYGGFLYILGSTMQSISRGKSVITDALVGLVIFFSSMLLLNTINPKAASLDTLGIRVAGRNDSFSNPLKEKQRAEEYATAKPTPEPPTVVDIPDSSQGQAGQAQPPTSTQQVPEQPAPGGAAGTPSTPPPPTPGKVVKDPYGNNVAQGDCPPDMRPVKYSADYEAKLKKHVGSFCMDTYEAPNQKGAVPYEGVTEWEADLYCNARGKRLCTTSEWSRACLGPKGLNTYGYGPDYKPGKLISAEVPNEPKFKTTNNPPAPCNYDSNPKGMYIGAFQNIQLSMGSSVYIPKTWEEDALNPESVMFSQDKIYKSSIPKLNGTFKQRWDVMMGLFDGYNAKEPSGSRSGCVTAEGVYDMPGNVAEISLSDDGMKQTIDQRIAKGVMAGAGKPYRWRGFYWSPIAHLGCTACKPTCNSEPGTDHALGWRGFENGFRCCMSLQE